MLETGHSTKKKLKWWPVLLYRIIAPVTCVPPGLTLKNSVLCMDPRTNGSYLYVQH